MTKLSGLPVETTFGLSDYLAKIKAAGAGDVIVTLQNLIAIICANLATGIATNAVATLETTASSTFTDLATAGPAVTVTIGPSGVAIVILTGSLSNNVGGDYAVMGFVASGANTIAATFSDSLANQTPGGVSSVNEIQASYVKTLTGLTPGSTTFTAKYEIITGGTGSFRNRKITVLPL